MVGSADGQVPETLLRAAAARRVILFIGAGFSRNISPNFPGGDDLLNLVAKRLRIDPALLKIHCNNDYKVAAEYLFLKTRSIHDYITDVSQLLDDEQKFAKEFADSRVHSLLPDVDFPSVYTTNWDRWIERAFARRKRPYQYIRDGSDVGSPMFFVPDKDRVAPLQDIPEGFFKQHRNITKIVKFHGDVSFANSIVLKLSDYIARMEFNNPLDTLLRSEAQGFSFLFIGYSFLDPNVQSIWSRIAHASKTSGEHVRSFLVTHEENPVMQSFLGSMNIETIRFPRDSMGMQLAGLLQAMQLAQGTRP